MNHTLKVKPYLFQRLKNGTKTFFVHEDYDQGIQAGDIVTMREWDSQPINATTLSEKGYTESEPLVFKVGFVEHLSAGRMILSLLATDEEAKPLPPAPTTPGKKTKLKAVQS